VESLGVERGLTPVPIEEKGRIANLSVGFVENDPDPSVELAAPLAEPSGLDVVRSVLL
jgi:hypothetical protein